MYMSIKSSCRTFQISHNFICQLCLSKAGGGDKDCSKGQRDFSASEGDVYLGDSGGILKLFFVGVPSPQCCGRFPLCQALEIP